MALAAPRSSRDGFEDPWLLAAGPVAKLAPVQCPLSVLTARSHKLKRTKSKEMKNSCARSGKSKQLVALVYSTVLRYVRSRPRADGDAAVLFLLPRECPAPLAVVRLLQGGVVLWSRLPAT